MPSASSVSISKRPPGDALLQRGALQVLHDDEGAAVLLADVVNRADVGVIQGGGGAGLAPETVQGVAGRGRIRPTET